ncbi:hypothetical protein L210DRAFT_934668 [Boletus edulis BED1]|uniref:Uncharacterized protein n=1 Tax=Boletus edulis BED1 TaxID=1328754 RepID=A0AAD4G8Y4_BOLED|nr:hypothetical protein L210DRAFT_934668 [Boletus edulis BED1]
MARAEEDRERLARTLDQACKDLGAEQDKLHALRQRTDEQSAALKQLQDQTEEERKRLPDQIKDAEEKCRKLEMEQQEAMCKNESLVKQLETQRQDMRNQAAKQSVTLMDAQAKMVEETERLATEIKAGGGTLAKERQNQLEEAQRQSEALRNTQLKINKNRRGQAPQAGGGTEKAKLENNLLMKRLAAEREEKMREAQANELALKRKADEARQRQAKYEEEIARVGAAQQKLEQRADRRVFGRYIHDMSEVMDNCVDSAGFVGLVGGLGIAPVVAGWRAIKTLSNPAYSSTSFGNVLGAQYALVWSRPGLKIQISLHPKDLPQFKSAEDELLRSVDALKSRNRILNTPPTLDELLNPPKEMEIREVELFLTGEKGEGGIVNAVQHEMAVARGEVIKIDLDEDKDPVEQCVTRVEGRLEAMQLCEELDKLLYWSMRMARIWGC